MEEKEQVIILINTDKKDSVIKKKNMTKKYCNEKNYDIVQIETIGYLNTFDLIELVIAQALYKGRNITKIILTNIDELVKNNDDLFIISTTWKKWDISIESITDGIVGKDIVFQLNLKKGEKENEK